MRGNSVKKTAADLNFWIVQATGWLFYFLFAVTGSIETFDSLSKAVIINGTFTLFGFSTTTGLRALFKSRWLSGKPVYHYVVTGASLSLLFTWVIVIISNIILLKFKGMQIEDAGFADLFEGTFKFLFVFLGWTGLYLGWKFYNDLQREKEKVLKAEAVNREMQLSVLRSQLNPHFLFNTLNSISALIHVNPAKAELLIDRFSDLLRKSLSNDGIQWISLDEEIDLLETYLMIEKIRYEDKLHYRILSDEDIGHVKVPTFLLYPLVENAVKYGMQTSDKPLMIRLSIKNDQNWVHIDCQNTGRWLDSGTENNGLGMGLKNVSERLTLAFDRDHFMSIHKNSGDVTIQLGFKINGNQKKEIQHHNR